MSAALKSEPLSTQPQRDRATAARRRQRLTVVPPQAVPTPVAFPTAEVRDRPVWLKLLVAGQRASLVLAGVTVTAALSAYAMTVDANRRLTAATATLGQLQDHQQQLITANAVFKNHLAQTAIAAMHDGTLHPKDVIFLEATAPSAAPTTAEPKSQKPEAMRPDRQFFPKGY